MESDSKATAPLFPVLGLALKYLSSAIICEGLQPAQFQVRRVAPKRKRLG